jgi:hypothetical protein
MVLSSGLIDRIEASRCCCCKDFPSYLFRIDAEDGTILPYNSSQSYQPVPFSGQGHRVGGSVMPPASGFGTQPATELGAGFKPFAGQGHRLG